MSEPSYGDQLSLQQETRLYINGFLLDGRAHNTLCVIHYDHNSIMERDLKC